MGGGGMEVMGMRVDKKRAWHTYHVLLDVLGRHARLEPLLVQREHPHLLR
jgi:hypothetical protein